MPRITADIDAQVLRALERLQKREGKSFGQLISELVAAALASKPRQEDTTVFNWKVRSMKARIPLEDKEAVRAALARTSHQRPGEKCGLDRS